MKIYKDWVDWVPPLLIGLLVGYLLAAIFLFPPKVEYVDRILPEPVAREITYTKIVEVPGPVRHHTHWKTLVVCDGKTTTYDGRHPAVKCELPDTGE